MRELIFFFALPCLIAIFSGMGMGGGGLLVVYLRLLGGDSQLALQSFNLIFFIFSSGAALSIHLPRRKIYGAALLIMALSGVVGALIGSSVALVLDGEILRKIFGGMLILTGIFSIIRSFAKEKPKKAKYDR